MARGSRITPPYAFQFRSQKIHNTNEQTTIWMTLMDAVKESSTCTTLKRNQLLPLVRLLFLSKSQSNSIWRVVKKNSNAYGLALVQCSQSMNEDKAVATP